MGRNRQRPPGWFAPALVSGSIILAVIFIVLIGSIMH